MFSQSVILEGRVTEGEKGGGKDGGSLMAKACWGLHNKELLAKQRTNVFFPQSPWCYLTVRPPTLEREVGWDGIGF